MIIPFKGNTIYCVYKKILIYKKQKQRVIEDCLKKRCYEHYINIRQMYIHNNQNYLTLTNQNMSFLITNKQGKKSYIHTLQSSLNFHTYIVQYLQNISNIIIKTKNLSRQTIKMQQNKKQLLQIILYATTNKKDNKIKMLKHFKESHTQHNTFKNFASNPLLPSNYIFLCNIATHFNQFIKLNIFNYDILCNIFICIMSTMGVKSQLFFLLLKLDSQNQVTANVLENSQMHIKSITVILYKEINMPYFQQQRKHKIYYCILLQYLYPKFIQHDHTMKYILHQIQSNDKIVFIVIKKWVRVV
eukprot:TRINITY_DN6407_c1_g2_i1.p1 TRINITY_DN6407_c1_g2~~TRINITY_DN6407_c1_g2_i1.p1  ORF type:complete len:301 (+),score=-36.71 TRINITY_DN6407_c1_g2_i1:193-1095(+)